MAKEKDIKALPSSQASTAVQKIATVPVKDGGFDANAALAEARAITDSDFYTVERYDRKQGKSISVRKPGARALQYEANKSGFKGIATKIIDAGVNEKQGWARLQGWPVSDPSFVKEEQVTITFEIEMAQLLFDRIDRGCDYHRNGCPIVKEDDQPVFDVRTGLPILKESREQLALIKQLVRIKKFADRTCITKCEARLHEKFLNMEWREAEEVEHEAMETAMVADARKKEQPIEQPAAQNKPPVAEKAAPPTPTAPPAEKPAKKAKEAPKEPPVEAPKEEAPIKSEMSPGGVPKAKIPPSPFASEGKTVKERVSFLCVKTACSMPNMQTFIAQKIGGEITKERAEDVKRVVATLETMVESESIKPFDLGAFVSGDNKDEKILAQFNELMKGGK